MRDDEDWQELLHLQCGVVSVMQAERHGWSRHARAAQVEAGRWRRLHRGVISTEPGIISYEASLWAGVLYAGEGAVVSHASAVWLADKKQPEPPAVHVLVPRTRKSRSLSGLRVHRGDYPDEDLRLDGCPPRLRVERAVLDSTALATSTDRAVAIVAGAIQRGLTTAERLRDVLIRLPALPRRRMLDDVLAMCGEGAHSLLEVEHERIRRGHGLPKPKRQSRHGKAVVDVDHDGLIIELDGRPGHLTVDSWWRDMLRDDLHTANRKAVLRFPGFVLLTQPHVVAHLEAAALRARGWSGPLQCPPGCPGLPEADAA